jgi:hypothetical protein
VKDLTGQRFGGQVVVGFLEMRNRRRYWQVRCDCGKVRPVGQDLLLKGGSRSCGCAKHKPVRLRQQWNLNRCPFASGSIKWGADMQYNPMGGEWVEAA